MDLGLRDKIILVTGGAKGIGAATVEAFSAEDCRVALVDRDSETGITLSKSLGSRVQYIEADLTVYNSTPSSWSQLNRRFLQLLHRT